MAEVTAPDTPPQNRFAVAACMRNEGIILLEWVAYHKAIGFDTIVVATNNCTDGTDLLCERLQELGHIIHIRNQPAPGEVPQMAGMRAILDHAAVHAAEWLLHIDADEFLNVSAGDGTVADLVAAAGDSDAIAIAWRMYGTPGLQHWHRASVLETQVTTEPHLRYRIGMHKCLFRPNRFGRAIDHMPKDPLAENVVLKNTLGVEMPNDSLFHARRVRHRQALPEHFTWANADIHHYAIRSEDIFLLKGLRGDGMGFDTSKYRINSTHWNIANRIEIEDRTIHRHLPAVREIVTAFRTDPETARLDDETYDWFDRLRTNYITPELRAKLTDDASDE